MMSEETVEVNSAADTVAFVAMCLLTVAAVAGNLVVLVAIVRSPSLRVQVTNFFVVNLCVVDLVAATVVMPMSLVGVHTQSSSVNSTLAGLTDPPGRSVSCTVLRLLSTFVAFASVLSIALANVERYVSIRHPMQHAAHLTVGRTLTAIVGVWAAALGVAATPVVADWDILDVGAWCCAEVVSSTPPAAAALAIVVVLLLFVLPTVAMAAMCCAIYRVAGQAGRQVVPGFDDGPRGSVPSPSPRTLQRRSSPSGRSASCSVVQSSPSCPTLNNIRPHNDLRKSATVMDAGNNMSHGDRATWPLPAAVTGTPECIIRVPCHEDDVAATGNRRSSPAPARVVEAQLTAGVVADRRWKAAATLLFVLLTFVALWSPYFAYGLYLAVERNRQAFDCDQAMSANRVETAVVWVGFVTFASNAFVYGWMNRDIRDALRDTVDATFSRCALAARERARLSQVLGAGDAEDFFQFLERTSSFDRTAQSGTASVELTTVNTTRP